MTDPLDSLWDEVSPLIERAPSAKTGKPAAIPANHLYSDPEYWTATCGVALIHEETNTLIGNYQEFRHKRDKGCRKLIRTDEPVQIARTERVSGAAWVHLEREIPVVTASTTFREIILESLPLASLGVLSGETSLRVCFQWGGITRVELLDHTTFHSPDNRTVLTLGKGTNIYECCDLDTKIAIKQELAI